MKNSVTLLGLASAAIIFLASRVEAVVINLGGTNYTITASSTTYEAAESALSSTPWFGNSTLAAEAAGLVGTALGVPNSNLPFVYMGPVFAYEASQSYGITRTSSQAWQGPVGGPYAVQGRSDSSTDTFFYAVATPVLDFTYTATATEVTITDYTGVGGAVVIPASINGTPVTAIGNYAFSSNSQGIQSITSLSIPDSVTSIGNDAFYYWRSLTNIEVDSTNPAYSSLGGILSDKNQTTLIQFPKGRSGSYTIPNSVTSIGSRALFDCSGLTSVTIPASVTSIGGFTFERCNSLTNITFKGNPPTIEDYSFYGLADGATVSYPSKATGWGATFGGLTTVVDYSDLFTYTTANNQATITGYTGTGGVVIIPASIDGVPVTAIGDNAFKGSISLTTVGIPASVTSIGYGAFVDCQGLDGIWVPVATVIASQAFSPSTTVFRYLTDAQLTSRDSQQNAAGQTLGQAAGRVLGQADVKNAPGTYGLYTAAQYAANYGSGQAAGRTAGQADVTSAPNTYGLYNLSQVQALNVGTPLLAKDSATGKFKLTVKAKKSTDLVNFSDMPFSAEDAVINGNGEMEFQFTSPDNAAFFRIESR